MPQHHFFLVKLPFIKTIAAIKAMCYDENVKIE